MSDYLDELAQKLTDAGLLVPERMEGCSALEIGQIEKTLKVTLPREYRRFLGLMGKAAGDFYKGTDWLYPDILELRSHAEALLVEAGAHVSLAPTDCVFAMHQGYQFLFFPTGAGDDPEVYRYLEGDESFERVADHFSEWLTGCAADEMEAAAEA